MSTVMQLSAEDKQVLDRDFSPAESVRGEIEHYKPLISRGNCRVVRGLIRTESEDRERKEMSLRIHLPGPSRRSSIMQRIWRVLA